MKKDGQRDRETDRVPSGSFRRWRCEMMIVFLLFSTPRFFLTRKQNKKGIRTERSRPQLSVRQQSICLGRPLSETNGRTPGPNYKAIIPLFTSYYFWELLAFFFFILFYFNFFHLCGFLVHFDFSC